MPGKFLYEYFKNIDLNDDFFTSLKQDYQGFDEWFNKKSINDEQALIFYDEYKKLGAFVYLKFDEQEQLTNDCETVNVPLKTKIGTFKLSDKYKGQRLGEGAIALALWRWHQTSNDQIYITTYPKQLDLINLLERFGFYQYAKKNDGELIYIKDKTNIDFSCPYKAFPFISKDFDSAYVLPINDTFHDNLFPYSELKNIKQYTEEIPAGNGISKIFIATPFTRMSYKKNCPVFFYRIHTMASRPKTYVSAMTSFGTITNLSTIKSTYGNDLSLDEFLLQVGNKSAYSINELIQVYNTNSNIVLIEFIYNGFFGKGHNVNHKSLKTENLFDNHPYKISYSYEQFFKILEMSGINATNIIIN